MANVTIPILPHYNGDVLFLAVANHTYGDRVPVQLGMQVLDQLVATMIKKLLQKAGETCRQVHLITFVSRRSTVKSLNDYGGEKG